jgi:predicted permease
MIASLKIIFSALLIWIIYVVVSTSLQSSLVEQWDFLASVPWMRATLWDFYANIFIIALWMFYKEKSLFLKILWLILFVCLGSIATCSYVLIKLFKLKHGEGVKDLVGNRG